MTTRVLDFSIYAGINRKAYKNVTYVYDMTHGTGVNDKADLTLYLNITDLGDLGGATLIVIEDFGKIPRWPRDRSTVLWISEGENILSYPIPTENLVENFFDPGFTRQINVWFTNPTTTFSQFVIYDGETYHNPFGLTPYTPPPAAPPLTCCPATIRYPSNKMSRYKPNRAGYQVLCVNGFPTVKKGLQLKQKYS